MQEARRRSPVTHTCVDSAVLSGFCMGAKVSLQGLASWVVLTGPSPRSGGVREGSNAQGRTYTRIQREREVPVITLVATCLFSVKPQ